MLDLHELEHRLATLRFRGAKGTTGTQASFLALFHGDHAKVRQLDRLVARKMGFDACLPRHRPDLLAQGRQPGRWTRCPGVGQSAHKCGTDLRLLAHRQEVDEPFEAEQVGSSAMAYKRNPMRAERMCGLARFLTSLTVVAAQTAATQWLERTLDDSVNRRLAMPQAFLAADAVLKLAGNLATGLVVNTAVIQREVAEYLPYLITENVLMAAVQLGGDRQEVHERLRQHSHAVTANLKAGGGNDLLERLRTDPAFAGVNFSDVLRPESYIGRSPEQVDEFLADDLAPILA